MKLNLRTRLAALAIGAASVLGLGLADVATAPAAEAFTTSTGNSSCLWPLRSGVSFNNLRAQTVTVRAYSHGGTYLGQKSFGPSVSKVNWLSSWEDVQFRIDYTYSGSITGISTYCARW